MKISLLLNTKKNNITEEKVLLKDLLFTNNGSSHFILFLATLFSNIPTPIIPIISSFFGFIMIIISFQILVGKKSIILPSFIQKIKIKKELVIATMDKLIPFFIKIENLTKVRMIFLFNKKKQRFMLNFVNFIMSIFIMIPLPFISFLPAIAVMLIIFGLMNKDGLYILFGLIISLYLYCCILYFLYFWKNNFN